MKIAIVGAGAMGSLFASYLASSVDEVWLYDVWQDHVDAISAHGLTRIQGNGEEVVRVMAASRPEDVGIADLILIFVKHAQTRRAATDALAMFGPDSWVLTLQNGIGNVEILEEMFPAERILFGLTTLPSELDGPGRVIDVAGGEGRTFLWPLRPGADPAPELFAEEFRRAGMHCELSADIERHIWEKLAVNCSYAAVCAVTRRKVGTLLDNDEAQRLIGGLIGEIVSVGRAKGVDLESDRVRASVRLTAEEGRDHVPSLLADVLADRRTEIGCLNGAVVAQAERLGVAVPLNSAIHDLIRTIEDSYGAALREVAAS
jgi:2-dehydropantoate 2-reductase